MSRLLIWIAVLVFSTAGCEKISPDQQTAAVSSSRAQSDSALGDGPPISEARGTIVAFGNSLTAGYGVPPQNAYPAQLEARLSAKGYPYRVVNAGISGDTTAGGLSRLDWLIRAEPEIVILELGANDGLRGFDLEVTRENLDRIISRLKAEGIVVILAGMKLPPNYGLGYTRRFSELFPRLAKEHNIPLIPFFLEGVAAQPALNQEDGLHPTAEGYRRIVENILPVLLPHLNPTRLSGR